MCDHYFLIAVLEIVICHRNPPNSMAHNHNTLSYLMLWWFRISCRAGQGSSSVWCGISRDFKVPLGLWWVLHCWFFTRLARRQRTAGSVHLSIHQCPLQCGKIMLNPHGGSRIWVRSSMPVKEAAWSFLSFLFARFHQLTLFQAYLDEREGNTELYISVVRISKHWSCVLKPPGHHC